MTTATNYKGFSISFKSNGVRIDTGRYHVDADGFNRDGYATIGTAKGAITKRIDQSTEERGTFERQPAAAATASKADYASVEVVSPVQASRNKREGRYTGKVWGKCYVRAGTVPLNKAYAIPSAQTVLRILTIKGF